MTSILIIIENDKIIRVVSPTPVEIFVKDINKPDVLHKFTNCEHDNLCVENQTVCDVEEHDLEQV